MLNNENDPQNTVLEAPVRHIVAFMFIDGISDDKIALVDSAFRALKSKIPQVVSIESSPNRSPEHKDQGYTRAWLVTFRTLADRDLYLPHPDHVQFQELAAEYVVKAFVYEIQNES